MGYADNSTKSTYRTDAKAEQALSEFVKNFYLAPKNAEAQGLRIYTQEFTDSRIQKDGVDYAILDMTRPGVTVNVDMKATLAYVNRDIPTFAFETSFYLRGDETKLMEGWFVNNKLQTHKYLLLWPRAEHTDLRRIRGCDFTEVFALLVDKKKLQRYLAENNLPLDRIRKLSEKLREGEAEAGRAVKKHPKHVPEGVMMAFSPQLAEKPVNIIISVDILFSLAEEAVLITRDGLLPMQSTDDFFYRGGA